MARAAINIIGATGKMYDLVSLGGRDVDSYRKDVGVYCVTGTQGMVPYPPIDLGWGYSLHPSENQAEVETAYDGDLLTVTVTMGAEPYDLKTMITLHILVPDLEPIVIPPVAVDPNTDAQARMASLRAKADYEIAPLQDAADFGEATESEVSALKAWKKYRVLLNRVTEQPGYPSVIEWPVAPD
ncbi:Caudovirales tail fibre assembly protein [Pseudomonas sp. 37 R 15]|uniref:tail fiber assembly protein n=1 Tax=Pseudomonas sp. 37 R 15 TaxID=1844104 RepID=UPI000811F69D|nr:tail fiber assembly protein [Pseudomonas sp. 37 R 15]CRM39928.1 Caudovirales tail fibre assembly protein [Pseudomonas sp. 37 R 15]